MAKEGVEIDLTPDRDGGVLKTILKVGTGEDTPVLGDVVHVHYVGKFENGDEFDSSRKLNHPFRFSLGEGHVIRGWDIGVRSMKLNEVACFKIAPKYGYGVAGKPPQIPANSTLVFEIELLRWTGEDISPDADGSIYKAVIAPGERHKNPSEYACVKVHAVGEYDGTVFYDKELNYELGEGSLEGLPDGVDKALRRFRKGEKARVTIKHPWNYGSTPPAQFNLPPNAELIFTLFLKEFDEKKHLWELDEKEKLDEAMKIKQRGSHFFQMQNYKIALDKYKAAISMIDFDRNVTDDMKKEWRALRIICHLNCAQVELNLKHPMEAADHCNKVIQEDSTTLKAHYRLGEADVMRKKYKEAIVSYRKVLELDPSNKAAVGKIDKCEAQIKHEKEMEKKRFASLFKNPAKDDKEELVKANAD